MKRILFIFALVVQTAMVMAQDDIYAVTKSGVTVDYLINTKYGKKILTNYLRVKTTSVQEIDEGALDITYSVDYLNKKKEIQKGTNMTDGVIFSFTVNEDGSYYLQDYMFGVGKDLVRNGFKLHMPNNLKVGDIIESGNSNGTYKFLGTNQFEIDFTDFQVVAEESIETPVGMFECFKISGKMKCVINRTSETNYEHTLWIAPKVGIVKMDYTGTNTPLTAIIDSITGL